MPEAGYGLMGRRGEEAAEILKELSQCLYLAGVSHEYIHMYCITKHTGTKPVRSRVGEPVCSFMKILPYIKHISDKQTRTAGFKWHASSLLF